MNKNRIYWFCQIVGWSLYALINSLLYLSEGKMSSNQVIILLLHTLFFLFSTHALRRFIIKWGWLRLYMARLIPKVMLAITVLAIINYGVQLLITYAFDGINEQRDFNTILILANIFSMMVLYLLWSLIYFMYHYVENYNTSLRYDASINEIKLNQLKSQLNPHFIFNALNSIRALVNEDPAKAKTAITQLSNILRNSLIMDKQRLISFNDEVRTVKDYLALETIRFEERLRTEWEIDPGSEAYQVPPLMIQTLVENGIKHGISSLVEGGWIKISTEVRESELVIRIRNSGQYLNGVSPDYIGLGLENTKERLKLIYGGGASFSIKNENESFVLTEVTIPKRV